MMSAALPAPRHALRAALMIAAVIAAGCGGSPPVDTATAPAVEAATTPPTEAATALRCPQPPPAATAVESIDWSRYGKLTLPVDEDGRRGPDEIAGAALARHASAYFFRARPGQVTAGGYVAGGGETVFVAPVEGTATTTHAKYLRSELREQIEPGNDRANWRLAGQHVLRGTALVTQLPTPKDGDRAKTVIAQIHGVDSAPPVKLQVASTARGVVAYGIYNDTPKGGSGNASRTVPVQLCMPIDYEIRVVDGRLTTTVNGEVLDERDLNAAWSADSFYFKAGNYVQNSAANASGAAEVVYRALTISHR